MTEQLEIPLFPLQRVLYPTVLLSLKIFEQRYLRLIKESLAGQTPFAVVPIVEGREVGVAPQIAPRGTVVEIVDWSQLANGLLGVVVRGGRRVSVASTRVEEDGLLFGKVTLAQADRSVPITLEDMDLLALLIELSQRLQVENYALGANLLAALVEGVEGDQLLEDKRLMSELDRSALVWRLADLLPVPKAEKIALFDLDEPAERLQEVRRWLLDLQSR